MEHVKQNKWPEMAETQKTTEVYLSLIKPGQISHHRGFYIHKQNIKRCHIYNILYDEVTATCGELDVLSAYLCHSPFLSFSRYLSSFPHLCSKKTSILLPSSHSASFSWCDSSLRRTSIALLSPLLCCHGNKEMK